MKHILTVTVLFTFVLLPGFVSAEVTEQPALSIVQLQHAQDISRLTAEEQKWYNTFQEGTFLVDGWQDIATELLASTPAKYRVSMEKRLEQLGHKMGMEWCRNNTVRRVDTKMLQQWGKTLKKTARKNPQQLPGVIASIDQELEQVLN